MIKIENVEVFNLKNAIKGMRNAKESWYKSDSYIDEECGLDSRTGFHIGFKDMELAKTLVKGGDDHSKFMRQIFVSMNITAPIHWWKEMDQYRVSVTTNSESTMHRLAQTPITKDCFSFDAEMEPDDDLFWYVDEYGKYLNFEEISIEMCELLRQKYLETKDKHYWRALIQLLPQAWNQMRTWTANYQVLRNIYFARKNHKLEEWRTFCKEIETLPYALDLICI